MVEWICHRFAESREEKVAGIKYLPGARPLLGFPVLPPLRHPTGLSGGTYPPLSNITGEERETALPQPPCCLVWMHGWDFW